MCSIKRLVSATAVSLALSSTAAVSTGQVFANDGLAPTIVHYNKDPSRFVAWLKQSVAEEAIPGVALAIVTRDSVLFEETWGLKDIAGRDPITERDLRSISAVIDWRKQRQAWVPMMRK